MEFRISRPMSDERGYITQEQYDLIFLACKDERERLLVRMLWKTGRRVSELLLLKVKDIDWDLGMISWQIEKKNILRQRSKETNDEFKARVEDVAKHGKPEFRAMKPLDSKSLEMLKNYIASFELVPENYVFFSPWKVAMPLTRFRVFQIIRKIGERAGINSIGKKGIHPHHFRHGFAVNVARKAKNPAQIIMLHKILEHSSMEQTMQYQKYSQEDLREILED